MGISAEYKKLIRKRNIKILEALLKHGTMRRSDLVRVVQSPRSTVYDALVRKPMCNFIVKDEKIRHSIKKTTAGRPAVYYTINRTRIDEINAREFLRKIF